MKALGLVILAIVAAGVVSVGSAQTNWTVVKTIVTSRDSISLYSVHKIGNLYIGFGTKNGGAIFTSSDGINWVFRSNSPNVFTSVAYTGSRYLAIGRDYSASSSSSTYIGISPDGNTWSYNTIGSAVLFKSIASSGSLAIATTSTGQILSSVDGITWTLRIPDTTSVPLNAVIWTPTKFIAVGDAGRCATSANGTAWTMGRLPLKSNLYAVTWTGAYIVATGFDGGSFVSTDGITWTIAATPILSYYSSSTYFYFNQQLIWSGKSLVRTDYPNIITTSTDGINWNIHPIDRIGNVNSIVFTGSGFLAYGSKYDTLLIFSSPLDSLSASPLAKKQNPDFSATLCRTGSSNFIQYSLTGQAQVSLRLIDLRGREVFSGINQTQGPGAYVFRIPSNTIATGRYVQVFEAGNFTKKDLVMVGR